MRLHVAGNERGESNGVPASLMCIHIVQVHLGGVDFRWRTTSRKACWDAVGVVEVEF